MSFDYKEMQELLDGFKGLQKQYEAFLRNFLKEMGMRALAQTKKLTPVDTGNLRNRWELSQVYRKGDSLYIVLFNPVEYASFVEEGHMQHRRFLPIKYLEESPKSAKYVEWLKDYYGYDMGGVMLQEKWIPGVHMARISINKIEKELPARYEKAFKQFVSGLGVM
jgi:hypothetical protein